MIPIPEPDLQWGRGALARVVERPLPTYVSPRLSIEHIENETDNKFETTDTGKLMYKQFNKTTGLLLLRLDPCPSWWNLLINILRRSSVQQ